jgi:hypothetical protein
MLAVVSEKQITKLSQPNINVKDVGVLYYTLSRGKYDKWQDLLHKLFGENQSINREIFNQCE